MKIALGVVAMIIAAVPRDDKAALEAAALHPDPTDTIPLRYDPDALSEYFSRCPHCTPTPCVGHAELSCQAVSWWPVTHNASWGSRH